MTARDLLDAAATRLEQAGVASPAVDAELLLSHVLGVSRMGVRLGPEPTESQRAEYEQLLVRRCAREPLQHLTGVAPFRREVLGVGPGVFIPRPETESLVEWALARLAELEDTPPLVVDLCTGSGAVAAAIIDEAPDAQVHAVELDEKAFEYATANLRGSGVDLRHGDIADALHDLDGRVDLVLANPPYVPLDAYDEVDVEVREHDPALALWSGTDGLEMIRTVQRVAARLLVTGGWVGCEHADAQSAAAVAVYTSADCWSRVRDHRDLAGRPRFVTARRS